MIEDYLAECEVHKVKYNKNTGGCPLCEAAAPKCKIGAWKGMKMSDLDHSNFE